MINYIDWYIQVQVGVWLLTLTLKVSALDDSIVVLEFKSESD